MSTLRERLARYKHLSTPAKALALAKRSVWRWIEWGSVIVFEMPLDSGSHEEAEGDVELCELAAADVPALAARFGRGEADLAERFAQGDRGFAARRGATLLHMRWAATRAMEIPECGLWLMPRPHEVYVYDAATHPAERGRRFTGAVRGYMDRVLARDGFRSKLAYVRADNHAMWRTLRDAPGLVRLGRIGYVRRKGGDPIAIGPVVPPVFRSRPT